jgi:Transposase IS66 family
MVKVHVQRQWYWPMAGVSSSQTAIRIVAQMDELFAVDARAREGGLTQADRHISRLENARPLLEQIKAAIQAVRLDSLPKSALAKACNYTEEEMAQLPDDSSRFSPKNSGKIRITDRTNPGPAVNPGYRIGVMGCLF